jgi:hypothetical protein
MLAFKPMRFSQRYGYTPVKSVIQIDSIDDELRNALWSALALHYWHHVQWNEEFMNHRRLLTNYGNEHIQILCQRLWLNFFKKPLDTLPNDFDDVYARLRKFFFDCKWYEVYDFIEFIAQEYPNDSRNDQFAHAANTFLQREVAAYRFVDGRIAQITDTEEIGAIEGAVASKKGPVREHLNRALQLLSDRRAPDYRNSIKESISAVEALVRSSCGSDKGTLGELLKQLGRINPVHPALEAAFTKLYGYTSDAKGIRHALLDEDRVTFEEAKFMLVACSAFVNYVRGILKA